MNINSHPALNEIALAYADSSDEPFSETQKKRNLSFRASQSTDAMTAQEIMKIVCPEYNEFDAELLGLFPDDCQITIAREGSVCIYVKKGEKDLPSIEQLKADEYDELEEDTYGIGTNKGDPSKIGEDYGFTDCGGYKGEIRIWWD